MQNKSELIGYADKCTQELAINSFHTQPARYANCIFKTMIFFNPQQDQKVLQEQNIISVFQTIDPE